MKKFTKINESFQCLQCQHQNTPAPQTCRNHCQECLHSLHVDIYPGDRASLCKGLLKPIGVEVKKGEMQSLYFCCEKCGFQGKNKIAQDDNRESLFRIFSNTKTHPYKR